MFVLTCLSYLAACGSSGNAGSASQAKASAGLRFADCMRSHGVPNFPDPSAGGGVQFSVGSGINPKSPAFQSARSQCFKLLPFAGPNRPQATAARKRQMLRLSECMRSHGVTGFPDPISTPPAPGHGLGLAFGSPGSIIAVPQALIQSPGFRQAAVACGFPGARGGFAGKSTLAPG